MESNSKLKHEIVAKEYLHFFSIELPKCGEDVEEEEGEDDDAGPKLEEADEECEADSPARTFAKGTEFSLRNFER